MKPSSLRRVYGVTIAAFLAVSAAIVAVGWDPERARIEEHVHAYLGDLRARNGESASRRIWPDDLDALKAATLVEAGDDSAYRAAAYAFLGIDGAPELAALPKERFFEFHLSRLETQRAELFRALSGSLPASMSVYRRGDTADVTVVLLPDARDYATRFSMNLRVVRSEGVWFIRI
jgi:hypothetical protein